MDRICDLPSFIVTGASASGKTTLIEQAVADGAIRTYPHIRQDYLGQVRCRVFTVFFSEKSSLRATFVKDYI